MLSSEEAFIRAPPSVKAAYLGGYLGLIVALLGFAEAIGTGSAWPPNLTMSAGFGLTTVCIVVMAAVAYRRRVLGRGGGA